MRRRTAPLENSGVLAALSLWLLLPASAIAEPVAAVPLAKPAAEPAAAPAPPPYDPARPETWRLSAKLGKASPEREALIADLTRKSTDPFEEPLTLEEAERVLDDQRAQPIYGEKTVQVIAPSMASRHHQTHVDLLKQFLRKDRLVAGARFYREKEAVLTRWAKKHQVEATVVVSILMWESALGTITGDYFAFNSFVSQGWFAPEASEVALASAAEKRLFDPKRQAEKIAVVQERARRNLVILMRQCKAKGMDPLSVKGSWAGALGFPQFMPASLRWAEDGDGDGKIDLYTFDDSIASIARYLDENGFAKDRAKAVWAYNHEDGYVKGVLAYADALKKELALPAAKPASDAGQPSPSPGAAANPAP